MSSSVEVEAAIHTEMNRLRGRLAGFLEACGLPEKQERGAITTLKSLTYDSEALLIDLISE